MIVLTIDTCEDIAKIELNKNGDYFFENLQKEESTSENLLVKLDNLLNKANVKILDVDIIGVCTGPGSFTGVRIALSCVKGLACATNAKLQGVNSFEKIAYKNNIKSNSIIVLPSGNSDIYYAVLEKNSTFEGFKFGYAQADEIVKLSKENGYKIYALQQNEEELKSYFKDEIIYLKNNDINFCEIVIKKTEKVGYCDINNLQPLYIKQSQAERELKSLVREKSEIKKPLMVQDLVEIENECFETDRYSEKMFIEELNEKTRNYYVTYYKGKPIAYIGLMIVENEMCLNKIAVIPEFRRLKLAQKLIEKALQIKRQRNIETFYLEVNIDNIPAIKLYEKLGFKTKHERKRYYQNGDSCLVMFYEA